MRESIARVEATRSARLQAGPPPAMTPAEREKVLAEFHPDYKAEKKRALAGYWGLRRECGSYRSCRYAGSTSIGRSCQD